MNPTRIEYAFDQPLEGLRIRDALFLGAHPPTLLQIGLLLLDTRAVLQHPDVVWTRSCVPRGMVLLQLHKKRLAESVHAVQLIEGLPEGEPLGNLLSLLERDVLAGLVAAPEGLERRGAAKARAEVYEPALDTEGLGEVKARVEALRAEVVRRPDTAAVLVHAGTDARNGTEAGDGAAAPTQVAAGVARLTQELRSPIARVTGAGFAVG